MRFEPKSEAEIGSSGVWPKGDYDFVVADAEETTSKAGNDMVKLTVHVFNDEGHRRTVFDYLVSTEKSAFKVRHFAEATGLLSKYEKGEMLAEEMISRPGRCKLIVKRDGAGQYPDQNGIADYLAATGAVAAPSTPSRAKAPAGDIDDEIPF